MRGVYLYENLNRSCYYDNFFENEAEFMDQAAKTPRSNCVLDTSKARKAGIGMKCVEEAMRESMRKMAEGVLV